MEPTRCKFGLILLVLAVLPDCPRAADHGRAQGGGPSLCYTFNVSAVGPSRCVVLGKISGTPFSKYTCGSLKAEPIGRLGKKLNATEAWEHHDEPWKRLGEEFHETLRENHQNISKAFPAPATAPATAPARATPPAVSATPATTPAAARSQDMTTVIVVPIILVIIACVIIVVSICYRKRKCCFRAPESVV